ncbi:MAG: hypothetical protein GX051_03905 [Clostridiales bacterium]|nr:hypothetical protein [Clostridiales bacterium]
MKFSEKIKSVVGIEGNTKEYLKPMIGYNSANIMIGGAGYPFNLYHAQFLTFVEGLGTKAAGTISLISGLTDAVTDPVMGVITDHTHSKYGKHRRYILWAVLPFAISYIMRWYSFGLSSGGNISSVFGYYLFAGILYSTAMTMANIPHTAMLPSIAPQYFIRTQFKMVEYVMNSIGQTTSFMFTALALSNFNIKTALVGLPDPSPADRSKYLMAGIVLVIWFSWPMIYSFFHTSEPSSVNEVFEPVNTRNIFRDYLSIFRNRSFRQYFVISLFYSMARGFYNTSDQYFIVSVADKYNLFNLINIISGVAEASGSPLNFLLVRYKGKQFCGKLLGPLMVAGLFLNIFVTPSTPSVITTVITLASAILYNFGFSGPGFVTENIQPDVIDVDELMTGQNREGMVSTFKSFFSKTINSLMSYIVGASLEAFGYDPQRKEPKQQTPRTLLGLRINFVIIPVIFAFLTVFTVYRYKMTKADHEAIKDAIRQKRETGHVEISDEEKCRIEKIAGHSWEDMWIGQPDTLDVTAK